MFGLGTVRAGGRVFAARVEGDGLVDLSGTFASTFEILQDWERNLERLDGPELALADVEVLMPLQPRQILQSGANYRQHVIDLAVDKQIGLRPDQSLEDLRTEVAAMMDERIANGTPYVFLGAHSALCGPFDDVLLPSSGEHDWELELAAVIGRGGRNVPVERALEHVAAYTIANDLTTRDLVQRPDLGPIGSDWLRSKNSPTFLPVGPWLVPAQFVPDPQALQIVLRLNGETMQDESTADMIFGVARLVSYVSETVGLAPGDLLLTGSPSGNGTHYGRFLQDGDVLEGEITGLGRQRNRCVDAPR